jgi:hypothetical protein
MLQAASRSILDVLRIFKGLWLLMVDFLLFLFFTFSGFCLENILEDVFWAVIRYWFIASAPGETI